MDPDARQTPLRVVIVDNHAISRAACRALLRTEGLEVLADLDGDERAMTVVRELAPDVVIVDVTPGNPVGIDIARRIQALPRAPRVVLTSCAERDIFGAALDGIPFLAKGDVAPTRYPFDEARPEPSSPSSAARGAVSCQCPPGGEGSFSVSAGGPALRRVLRGLRARREALRRPAGR